MFQKIQAIINPIKTAKIPKFAAYNGRRILSAKPNGIKKHTSPRTTMVVHASTDSTLRSKLAAAAIVNQAGTLFFR
ncbi:hypothetical protein HMPREF9413_5736 [Paenibacillus sp. HGF7]|nr:hypothetical protein HMPREF9413_5736 [Paenibacillus sp. HGF7]